MCILHATVVHSQNFIKNKQKKCTTTCVPVCVCACLCVCVCVCVCERERERVWECMCMHSCVVVWVDGHPSIHYAHQCILITFVTVKHADEEYLVGFSWPLKEITVDVAQRAFTLVFHGLQQTQQPFSPKLLHKACRKHNSPSALNFSTGPAENTAALQP